MSRSERAALLLAALLAAALAFGLWRLFLLRFSAGDVFPAYSSLRSDPLGTKILFESLPAAGLTAERGYRPLAAGDGADLGDATVLYLGASRSELVTVGTRIARALEGAASGGARLVIAFRPEREPPPPPDKPDDPPASAGDAPRPGRLSLPDRWGFRYGFAALRGPAAAAAGEDLALWHSTLVFADLDPAWRVLQTRRGRPVLVERDFGGGSIVLCADAYPLSNEAMQRARRPELLARIVGGKRRVLFDEAHLGVVRPPGGIVSLLGKYRLGGLAAGLAVLAALAIWHGASPFLPPRPEPPGSGEEAPGRGSAAALVDLLRRNIPPGELPAVCLREWARTFPDRRRRHPERYERALAEAEAERARPPKSQDPAGACRRIARILKGA